MKSGVRNRLKNIFKILRTNLINSLPIRNLENNDLKLLLDIIPFLHRNTSSSIFIQITILISLVFCMGKWISIKI